jgi:hypothetical protein
MVFMTDKTLSVAHTSSKIATRIERMATMSGREMLGIAVVGLITFLSLVWLSFKD